MNRIVDILGPLGGDVHRRRTLRIRVRHYGPCCVTHIHPQTHRRQLATENRRLPFDQALLEYDPLGREHLVELRAGYPETLPEGCLDGFAIEALQNFTAERNTET